MKKPIVSYHPLIKADYEFLLVDQRPLDQRDHKAMSRAAAIILPQACRPDLYCLSAGLQKRVFPNPSAYLSLNGKVGNHRLFKAHGLPHPKTVEFKSLHEALNASQGKRAERLGFGFPLVVKGAGGGEGRNVFLARTFEELAALDRRISTFCVNGPGGLVLQEYLECGARDIRVIFIGEREDVFWRVGAPGGFRANLSQGGRIERGRETGLLKRALDLARRFKRAAGIDLTAVDMLYPPGREPLLLEVNHYFGRRALAGGPPFEKLFLTAARDWLGGLGLDPKAISLKD